MAGILATKLKKAPTSNGSGLFAFYHRISNLDIIALRKQIGGEMQVPNALTGQAVDTSSKLDQFADVVSLAREIIKGLAPLSPESPDNIYRASITEDGVYPYELITVLGPVSIRNEIFWSKTADKAALELRFFHPDHEAGDEAFWMVTFDSERNVLGSTTEIVYDKVPDHAARIDFGNFVYTLKAVVLASAIKVLTR